MKRFLIPIMIALLLFSVLLSSCSKEKSKGSSEISVFGEENKPVTSQNNEKNKAPTTTTKKGGTAVEYPTYSTQAPLNTTGDSNSQTPGGNSSGNSGGNAQNNSGETPTTTSKAQTGNKGDDTSFIWESRVPNLQIPNAQTPELPQLPNLPDTPKN